MANFSLKNFQAQVRTGGLARPNRFEVLINLPPALIAQGYSTNDSKILSLFCESTNLPMQTIGVKTQRIQGPAYQRPVSVDYGGEGITMTFLIDQQMDIKGFFDAWMSKIIDPIQYFVYYQDSYVAPITINQLNQKDNTTYSVILEDAFPRSVSLLELNNSAQNQVHKLNVTFSYRRWAPVHRRTNNISYPSTNSGIDESQNSFTQAMNGQADTIYDAQQEQLRIAKSKETTTRLRSQYISGGK
jgi:hypothetical protein